MGEAYGYSCAFLISYSAPRSLLLIVSAVRKQRGDWLRGPGNRSQWQGHVSRWFILYETIAMFLRLDLAMDTRSGEMPS